MQHAVPGNLIRKPMTSAKPTIRLRRSGDRGFEDFGWADNWMTFSFAGYADPEWNNYGPLRVMVENHIQPHEGFSAHPHRDVEIVTYVSSGILTHGDSFGHEAGISAGEMQLISAGSRGMIHSEENKHDVVEHNYQMWLVPNRFPTSFAYHQLGFSTEERKGRLRMYVSPDGRDGSMPINTNAFIYAGLFEPGQTAVHDIDEGRGVWIQVVDGRMDVTWTDAGDNALALVLGDGAGISDIDKLSLSFRESTELLLFDVRLDEPMIWS